jgi:hypothetical protein
MLSTHLRKGIVFSSFAGGGADADAMIALIVFLRWILSCGSSSPRKISFRSHVEEEEAW